MKTISDIKENVELLHRNARMETEEKIFSYYKDVPEIMKVINDLENYENGEYSIDRNGELIYSIELSKEMKDLPEIGAFLESYFGSYNVKDGTFFQWCGEFISINWNHSSAEYFIYDHDARKSIMEKNPDIDDDKENYIRAVIEKYMRARGVFGDVIEIDYYGNYNKHFNMRFPDREENLDAVMDEELQSIIDKFERGQD